ncbi:MULTISPECIES: FxLYD domain-containing protein [unclassified Clostridium]|uniref:FxLYD domain-containing protein n=1 Tax=unclassified Clostridium TaxID=2614128 RepID=UPI0002974133|nr:MULTISPECIES: FxLYD domain-containing protein [unclassified Clostridium]EKQ51379.1 MAG: hypothetical protein A370_04906 [Clostridium sp. Maddingley MBC34-26]
MSKMINCKACGKEIAKGAKICPNCGKDQRNFFGKHKILTGILVLIILSGLGKAMSGNGGSTSGTTKTATANSTNENDTKSSEVKKEDAISFSNILITSNSGITVVNGEAKSNDGQKHTFTIKVSFYDKDKKLLGTAVGSVNELQPTETKIFSAMGTADYSNSDSYKVEVDTMVQSSKQKDTPKITFSNLVAKENSGITMIDGEVKNDDSKEHSFTIVVGFYDADNKLIGTATGSMNKLPAGATKTYSAMATGKFGKAAKYTVQVDSLVQ